MKIIDYLTPTQIAVVAKMLESNEWEQVSKAVLEYPNDRELQRETFEKLTKENIWDFAIM